MEPVSGREVVEGEQHVFVLSKTLTRLRVAVLIEHKETTVSFPGVFACRSQVHLVQQALGVRLHALGHLIEDVGDSTVLANRAVTAGLFPVALFLLFERILSLIPPANFDLLRVARKPYPS